MSYPLLPTIRLTQGPLARFLADRPTTEHCRLLHCHGKARAGDLAALLKGTGWDVLSCLTYLSVPIEGRAAAVRAAQTVRSIDAVLHFSPRAARHYAEISHDIAPIQTHACLSSAVAKALQTSIREGQESQISIRTADVPNQDALLDALIRNGILGFDA
jgi:uroporphyrinogen-III synthase